MSVKHSKIMPVAILFVVLMMTSCGGAAEEIAPTATPETAFVEEGASVPDLVAGECSNPYLPVVLNANWAYAASGGEVGPYTFTTTVSEVFPDRFTLTLEFDDLTLTQHWECTSEGLVALELGGGTAASLVTGDVEANLETSNIEGVTIPAGISAGDTWTHSMDVAGDVAFGDGMSGIAEGRATSTFQAVGMESVEVPAGTFEALRVDSEFTLDLTVTTDGFSLPVAFTGTGSTWYAPNSGWVLQTSSSTFFEMATTEMIELQTYSIP